MYDTPRELVEALRATPETLAGLLHDVTQERAASARGGDEDWSVLEVVCHLRDAEEFGLGRVRAMRDGASPSITGFDQAAWAEQRNYAADDLWAVFDTFARLRAFHIAELAALPAEGWERTGRHVERGTVTIANHTLHMIWHDAVHMAQVARTLIPRIP